MLGACLWVLHGWLLFLFFPNMLFWCCFIDAPHFPDLYITAKRWSLHAECLVKEDKLEDNVKQTNPQTHTIRCVNYTSKAPVSDPDYLFFHTAESRFFKVSCLSPPSFPFSASIHLRLHDVCFSICVLLSCRPLCDNRSVQRERHSCVCVCVCVLTHRQNAHAATQTNVQSTRARRAVQIRWDGVAWSGRPALFFGIKL